MNSNQVSVPLADILVIDDTPDNLRLLSTMLSEQGYKVRKVITGQLALRVVTIAPPDLILLDINMPQMNGFEVCEKLKADPQTAEIPVIFISALNDVWDKVKAFEAGGVDYITKPFQCQEVLARVRNQLTLRWFSKQLREQNERLHQEIRDREAIAKQCQQAEEALRQSEAREREKTTHLELALSQLRCLQAQLIQTGNISSYRQTVAGVAREINNPVSSIWHNLPVARQYFQNLLSLVELYQQTYPQPTPKIQQLTSDLDLELLVEDWEKLMASIQTGSEYIYEIVRSLLNESDLKPVDIHESLNNTLLLLEHRLRADGDLPEIQVIKDYGQLPLAIACASQLNQVFANLLKNAIDALETQPAPRTITITTSLSQTSNLHTQKELPQSIVIRIADNGPGMSEDVKKKIFDPFFTTKPVGCGTGLGLSISYQIVVEKHNGQLRCVSVPGQGTEFIVELPLYRT